MVNKERSEIEREIEIQAEKKARMELQILMLKAQVAQAMEETDRKKESVIKRVREVKESLLN